MPPMEIERKFTVKALPENLDSYPFHLIEQAYLNTDPVLRIRRQDDEYYLSSSSAASDVYKRQFKHRPRPAHPQTG